MAARRAKSNRRFQARLELGKNLMTLANLAAGALIFGQAFSGFAFNFRVALLGLLLLVWLYVWAWAIMKGGE